MKVTVKNSVVIIYENTNSYVPWPVRNSAQVDIPLIQNGNLYIYNYGKIN